MSRRNMTFSEKKRIWKKLAGIAAAVAVAVIVCVVVVTVVKPASGNAGTATPSDVEGLIEVDGVRYVPKKNIETYLFMGVDSMDKVADMNVEEDGAGRCDVVSIMVRDVSEGTYKTLTLDRNMLIEQDSLEEDGTYIGTSPVQLAIAHENGDGKEISCENVVKAVSNFLGGQKIDGYAAVNMGAIGTINNLAGGVTVTIEDDFSDTDPSLVMGETITLTDEQAMHYVRARYNMEDDSNGERMRRQEAYKADLKVKLAAKCNEDNSYPVTIYHSLEDYMVTDIKLQKFTKLAMYVLQEDRDEGSLHIEGTESMSDLGFIEVTPDEDSVQQVILELFYKEYTQ